MHILPVTDKRFARYGHVIQGIDTAALLEAMEKTPAPDDVVYVPSDPALEALPIYADLTKRVYGQMPVQIGYCNGFNHTLNALEYHRSSEVNLACTDLILLIGAQQDVDLDAYTYDTAKAEAFLVPAGTLIEVYATTLHYAPISATPEGKFRCVVVLPRDTNLPLEGETPKEYEDKLLFARNKWLIAHPESGLDKDGAFVGLTGDNITI